MANTPASGIYYPDGATAANLAAILSDMATSIDARTVSTFASTSARDTAFSGLTAAQRAGAKVYVTGVGWQGYNASSGSYNSANWVAEQRVKGGLLTTTVESNGNARIPSASCFFSGQAPTAVVATGFSQYDTVTFAQFDGGGALMRAYNAQTHVQASSGTQVTFMWMSFR